MSIYVHAREAVYACVYIYCDILQI